MAGPTHITRARGVSQRIELMRRRISLSWSHHQEVAAFVSGRVEVSRRRETLSWSHHSEVAPFEPDVQELRGLVLGCRCANWRIYPVAPHAVR